MSEKARENDLELLDTDKISQIEKALDLKYIKTVNECLIFDSPARGTWPQREVAVPIDGAIEILQAIDRGAERMAEHEGWIDPEKGFAEFEVNQHGINAFRPQSISKFKFEIHPCSHAHAFDPPFARDESRDHISTVIRVTSRDGSTCIEISPNSALCIPLTSHEREQVRTQRTLKVYFGGATERSELLSRSRDLANSFLFELNARHRCPYSLRPKRESLSPRPRRGAIAYTVRFPKTPVPNNIATLFSIPSDFTIRGNHTLFYLSYYQVLEHYLPAIHRRETVRKVRRILRSLDFDEEKDSSVLQILNSVERSRGASEGDQLRILVEECVQEGKLQEFFALDHGSHFGNKGPISGIPAINLKSGESLASQVAKRIYMLRNRIVHAKDDARYAESKVLLPLSREAMRLYPDIELIRVLAIEVIADNR
ncbi:hypothetical protein [Streptomyces sp. NPDC020742]|uniref:hypothetical protein n=1 Tax=Streptomyces sp. NPDC020742 TaxID=3154897 RepID=UPI003408338B